MKQKKQFQCQNCGAVFSKWSGQCAECNEWNTIVETIVTGLRWRAARDPMICKGDFQDAFADQCEELGALMAAGLDAGIF